MNFTRAYCCFAVVMLSITWGWWLYATSTAEDIFSQTFGPLLYTLPAVMITVSVILTALTTAFTEFWDRLR